MDCITTDLFAFCTRLGLNYCTFRLADAIRTFKSNQLVKRLGAFDMTGDEYLQQIISKHAVSTGQNSPAYKAACKICPVIEDWSNNCLTNIIFSGSYAKGTVVKDGTDVDLFISLNHTVTTNLKEIYDSLYDKLYKDGYRPRKQNVSIGITLDDIKIDLIPAKRQDISSDDHSIFKNKQRTWMKTNIVKHINKVKNSNRIDEIKLTKVWRNEHNLDFPSIYLELFVIYALHGKNTDQLSTNMMTVLSALATELLTKSIVDPANTNNIISDDTDKLAKCLITLRSCLDKKKQCWSDVFS